MVKRYTLWDDFGTIDPDENDVDAVGCWVLYDDYAALEARVAELEKDAARIDSLEDVVCASRTGVTIERVRYAEDGYVVESGFRAMRFHAVTELNSTIREAIDELLSREA